MIAKKPGRTISAKAKPRVAAKPATVVKPTAKPVPRKAVAKKTPAVQPKKPVNTAAVIAEKPKKEKKVKVLRDSFTMPEADYAKIADLKKKCIAAGFSAKKSELLRAGLHALDGLSAQSLKLAISKLENVKTGRPVSEKNIKKS